MVRISLSLIPRPHLARKSLPILKAIHAGVVFGSGSTLGPRLDSSLFYQKCALPLKLLLSHSPFFLLPLPFSLPFFLPFSPSSFFPPLLQGDWVAGKREGKGDESSQYGTYRGCWKNDMKQGYGEEKSLVGTIFEGTWEKNRKHGRGVRKMVFGTIEEQVGVAVALVTTEENDIQDLHAH